MGFIAELLFVVILLGSLYLCWFYLPMSEQIVCRGQIIIDNDTNQSTTNSCKLVRTYFNGNISTTDVNI